ncbi:MAG: DNA helicase [Microbacterium sp.]
MNVSLSRKRQKELRRLQEDAGKLWQSQQAVAGHAAEVAREAGRQLGHLGREQVMPVVQENYSRHVAPRVDSTVRFGKHVVDDKVVPIVGGVVGTALSAWDVANAKRHGYAHQVVAAPAKQGPGLGRVIAVVLGVAAAVGVLAAAWQALRADDELWVADDPLSPPDA